MAQPTWNGLDPLTITDGVLDIGRGDWVAGQGGEALKQPKWMPVVWVDGAQINGVVPQMPSVNLPENGDVVYPGEVAWEQRKKLDLAAFGYADGKEHYGTVRRYAASFFDGWGDHPQDAWEWGHYNTADLVSEAVSGFTFTLGGAPTRRSSRPHLPAAAAS